MTVALFGGIVSGADDLIRAVEFCAHDVNKSSGPVFDEYLHPVSRRNVLSSHLKRGFVSAAACRCCCCCLCCCRHG